MLNSQDFMVQTRYFINTIVPININNVIIIDILCFVHYRISLNSSSNWDSEQRERLLGSFVNNILKPEDLIQLLIYLLIFQYIRAPLNYYLNKLISYYLVQTLHSWTEYYIWRCIVYYIYNTSSFLSYKYNYKLLV